MNRIVWSLLLMPLLIGLTVASGNAEKKCQPTEPDALGPFYKPGAPERTSVGQGYALSGQVKSTACRPIAGAQLEFWLAGPDGTYDDAHRATVYPNQSGEGGANFNPERGAR